MSQDPKVKLQAEVQPSRRCRALASLRLRRVSVRAGIHVERQRSTLPASGGMAARVQGLPAYRASLQRSQPAARAHWWRAVNHPRRPGPLRRPSHYAGFRETGRHAGRVGSSRPCPIPWQGAQTGYWYLQLYITLERKYIDENFVTGFTECYHFNECGFGNYRCSHWRKFRQYDWPIRHTLWFGENHNRFQPGSPFTNMD